MAALKPLLVDVRKVLQEGQEPCHAIDAALAELRPEQGLQVIAPFMPSPLVERLRAEGFNARPSRRKDGAWQVDFVRASSQ